MNLQQSCCVKVVLIVLLVFANESHAIDDTSSQEYTEDESEDIPPDNVDFEPFQSWTENEMVATETGGHCPPPPPTRTPSPDLCNRTSCTHDNDCSRSADNSTMLMCCFNGCIRSCVYPLDPPIAFDWIEKPTHMEQSIVESEAAHSSAPESMALPGGCVVSTSQYNKLETFKTNQHVSHCFCDIGGIFCKIAES